MKKPQADSLAIKMAAKIITVEPKAIIGINNIGSNAANSLADFIKTLSSRLESDIDEQVYHDVLDKS